MGLPREGRTNRRTFLATALAAATGAAAVEESRVESLSEWLAASADARGRALATCLNRIKEMEPSIHGWVQVSPQKPTGHGKLYGIPFGVKDIVETRGLLSEYGSPIYQGRIGTADAPIVHDLRNRGAILLGKTETTAFAYRTPMVQGFRQVVYRWVSRKLPFNLRPDCVLVYRWIGGNVYRKSTGRRITSR